MFMKHKALAIGICWITTFVGSAVVADTKAFEDFGTDAQTRWKYIADGVMGGVSDGRAEFANNAEPAHIRLTGTVSTENNGGFIQVRRLMPDAWPEGTEGLTLDVRGNGEDYYVFLRTSEMTRPWHFYNASFRAEGDWSTVQIPLGDFERSHDFLADPIDPQTVISIGLVAYGRDHLADLSVGSVALY